MKKDRKPNIQLFCKIIVKDKDGKLISEREIECDSFLSNFLALLRSALTNSFQTAVSVDGVVRTQAHIGYYYSVWTNSYSVTYLPLPNLRVDAPEANASYGIVVGTGTTPVSPTDYKLENQIPHGTGSGQLYHRAVSLPSLIVTESGVVQKIQREFENRSTADVTVNEVGIYGFAFNLTTATTYAIVRDVLQSGVTIPSGGTAFLELWWVTPA